MSPAVAHPYPTQRSRIQYDKSVVTFDTGQIIDGPQNGPAPGPWVIGVQPSQMFSPSSTRVEVPHTASVKVYN